jgi:hypothetical protein
MTKLQKSLFAGLILAGLFSTDLGHAVGAPCRSTFHTIYLAHRRGYLYHLGHAATLVEWRGFVKTRCECLDWQRIISCKWIMIGGELRNYKIIDDIKLDHCAEIRELLGHSPLVSHN